jgi:hypothetical protein
LKYGASIDAMPLVAVGLGEPGEHPRIVRGGIVPQQPDRIGAPSR